MQWPRSNNERRRSRKREEKDEKNETQEESERGKEETDKQLKRAEQMEERRTEKEIKQEAKRSDREHVHFLASSLPPPSRPASGQPTSLFHPLRCALVSCVRWWGSQSQDRPLGCLLIRCICAMHVCLCNEQQGEREKKVAYRCFCLCQRGFCALSDLIDRVELLRWEEEDDEEWQGQHYTRLRKAKEKEERMERKAKTWRSTTKQHEQRKKGNSHACEFVQVHQLILTDLWSMHKLTQYHGSRNKEKARNTIKQQWKETRSMDGLMEGWSIHCWFGWGAERWGAGGWGWQGTQREEIAQRRITRQCCPTETTQYRQQDRRKHRWSFQGKGKKIKDEHEQQETGAIFPLSFGAFLIDNVEMINRQFGMLENLMGYTL